MHLILNKNLEKCPLFVEKSSDKFYYSFTPDSWNSIQFRFVTSSSWLVVWRSSRSLTCSRFAEVFSTLKNCATVIYWISSLQFSTQWDVAVFNLFQCFRNEIRLIGRNDPWCLPWSYNIKCLRWASHPSRRAEYSGPIIMRITPFSFLWTDFPHLPCDDVIRKILYGRAPLLILEQYRFFYTPPLWKTSFRSGNVFYAKLSPSLTFSLSSYFIVNYLCNSRNASNLP